MAHPTLAMDPNPRSGPAADPQPRTQGSPGVVPEIQSSLDGDLSSHQAHAGKKPGMCSK